MAEIVAPVAASHAPFMAMQRQCDWAQADQREPVMAGCAGARCSMGRTQPGAIVIFSSEIPYKRGEPYDNGPGRIV